MMYKKGMYVKKTHTPSGIYIIGKLIKPMCKDIPFNLPQSWLVKIYVNHGYTGKHDDETVLLIPTGDTINHRVKIYKDYPSLVADTL